MNLARVPPLLGTIMQLQNEFHLQPNSWNLEWAGIVTPNHEVGHHLNEPRLQLHKMSLLGVKYDTIFFAVIHCERVSPIAVPVLGMGEIERWFLQAIKFGWWPMNNASGFECSYIFRKKCKHSMTPKLN